MGSRDSLERNGSFKQSSTLLRNVFNKLWEAARAESSAKVDGSLTPSDFLQKKGA